MALTAPTQQRATDPYSEDRYSSLINRFTRMWTRGEDVILEPHASFDVTYDDWKTVTIQPGLFIKDDALVHLTAPYSIDMTDNLYYVDFADAMISTGYYILVAEYNYARTLPSPVAYYKVIRDEALYSGALQNYVFLGAIYVTYNGTLFRFEVDLTRSFFTTHPEHLADPDYTRRYVDHTVDGGELT